MYKDVLVPRITTLLLPLSRTGRPLGVVEAAPVRPRPFCVALLTPAEPDMGPPLGQEVPPEVPFFGRVRYAGDVAARGDAVRFSVLPVLEAKTHLQAVVRATELEVWTLSLRFQSDWRRLDHNDDGEEKDDGAKSHDVEGRNVTSAMLEGCS